MDPMGYSETIIIILLHINLTEGPVFLASLNPPMKLVYTNSNHHGMLRKPYLVCFKIDVGWDFQRSMNPSVVDE